MGKDFSVKDVVLKATDTSLHAQLGFLLGRLLTIVDASIVDKEQKKAMKDLVSQEVWDKYNHLLEIWGGKGRLINDGTRNIVDPEV